MKTQFQSLLEIGALLKAENIEDRFDLECHVESVSNDIDATVSLIGRLLAAADPSKVSHCLGDVGRLLEGLSNLNQKLMGDLGEFHLITS